MKSFIPKPVLNRGKSRPTKIDTFAPINIRASRLRPEFLVERTRGGKLESEFYKSRSDDERASSRTKATFYPSMNGIAASDYVRLAAFTEHERSIMLAEERYSGLVIAEYLKTIVQWKEVCDESRKNARKYTSFSFLKLAANNR